jgi:hypothetical protein
LFSATRWRHYVVWLKIGKKKDGQTKRAEKKAKRAGKKKSGNATCITTFHLAK